MRRIRIALGSNDGVAIVDTHMGDTLSFYIYDLFEDSKSEFVDRRDNPVVDGEHGKAAKMKTIVALLEDVDVLAAKTISPNFRRIAEGTKHQPVIVDSDSIDDALARLHAAFDEILVLSERRAGGERFSTIPEI